MAQAKYKPLTGTFLEQKPRAWCEGGSVLRGLARNNGAPQVPIMPLGERHADISCGFANVLLPRIEGVPALAAVRILPG